MFSKDLCESFRSPTDQVRNLSVAYLNDSKLAVGSVNEVHGVKPAEETFRKLMHNGWRFAKSSVDHTVHDEVTAFGVRQK